MKKIGFIDYYISEWHANSYPKWIEEANEALGTDYKVAYAWAEVDKLRRRLSVAATRNQSLGKCPYG